MVKAKVFVKAQEFVGFPTVDNFKLETQEVDDNLCEGGIFKEFCLKSSFLFCLEFKVLSVMFPTRPLFQLQHINRSTSHIILQSSSLKHYVLHWILTHGMCRPELPELYCRWVYVQIS